MYVGLQEQSSACVFTRTASGWPVITPDASIKIVQQCHSGVSRSLHPLHHGGRHYRHASLRMQTTAALITVQFQCLPGRDG